MALSPMMQHYLDVKEKNKDCIIFYRLGDFYEMFFEDAIKVSKLLDLTLTGRDCGLNERAPMCGIPFHAADNYIAKLVSLGEKVAICEQLNQPVKGELVQRDIVKVVTAGTIINNELIDDKTNNFLGSVYQNNKNFGFSYVDITTGEFLTKNFSGENSLNELLDYLVKVSPVEIISTYSVAEFFNEQPLVRHAVLPRFSAFTESEFNLTNARNNLKKQFNTLTLEPYSIEDEDECICSAGALISYLKQTQKHALININSIKKESSNEFIMLDINTIRNLELIKTLRDGKRYGSLLWILDKTKTSMGARKLQSWILSPLFSENKINYRLDGVECFYNNTLIREGLSDLLDSVRDIARLSGKISNGNLMPKDCVSLRKSLEVLPNIKFQLLGLNSQFIIDIYNSICDFSEMVELLNNAIDDEPPATTKDGGYIKKGFNKELDELRNFAKNSKGCIAEIENRERELTGIRTLRIGYNRVFGYYIEVTNSFKDKVPYEWQRRQTLANAERYVTEELKELEIKILSSEEKSLQLEANLYQEIKDYLSSKITQLKETADGLANLDVLLSFAKVSRENNYVRPKILCDNDCVNLVESRHPVVEKISKQRFVSNDCYLDNADNRMLILTGPNMAGKSTYMRQIALNVLMAHVGCFVPAKVAEIPLVDKIFTRIGASDNLISDQSTFMVEMSEVATILNNATNKSLIIFDEIGRGTSTYDGLSIAWAVVEYVVNVIKAKTLFATHYHELTELEGKIDGVKNYKVTVKEMAGSILFVRKIMRGGANKSFGVEVADLAGVKKEVISRAKEILKSLERSSLNRSSQQENGENFQPEAKQFSQVERIISDLDLNNLSPMQALSILSDLQDKIKDNL